MGINHAPGHTKPNIDTVATSSCTELKDDEVEYLFIWTEWDGDEPVPHGLSQFATGVNIASAKGNPRILFTSCFTKRRESSDCGFARFHPASAFE